MIARETTPATSIDWTYDQDHATGRTAADIWLKLDMLPDADADLSHLEPDDADDKRTRRAKRARLRQLEAGQWSPLYIAITAYLDTQPRERYTTRQWWQDTARFVSLAGPAGMGGVESDARTEYLEALAAELWQEIEQEAEAARADLRADTIFIGDYVTLNDTYGEAWRDGHVTAIRTFTSPYSAEPVTMLTLGFGHRADSSWYWRHGTGTETPARHVVKVQRNIGGMWQTVHRAPRV